MGVASFDYWIVSRVTWLAPMIHDENIESQKIGIAMTEETRALFEERFGLTDPYRVKREELLKDDKVFLREMSNLGPPRDDDGKVDRATWVFWWCMILDTHLPIIANYGRYPYRNAILGRESTAAENRWLDDTSHIAEAPADVAARIKSDIAKGIWTPLGQSA
ncbi:hypothetical protein NQ176_g2512 [Zarea fungicola]|uniref:Uncharacterized protein n=1 Tax=Zarea fungicola TaxID=93591 RepID=A0ACC1NPC8_9HYPO|nr:hypothetical protein NQ176_g2512 [Lecanicillium fungicola]